MGAKKIVKPITRKRPRSIIRKTKKKENSTEQIFNINNVPIEDLKFTINSVPIKDVKTSVNLNIKKNTINKIEDLFICYLVYREIYCKKEGFKKEERESLYDFYHKEWKDEDIKNWYLSFSMLNLYNEEEDD